MALTEGLTSQQPWWSQPPERFPARPNRFSGVFLSLPNVGWENAQASTRSLPPHKLHCGCPFIRCVSTRLAMFGGYRRASRPTLSLAIDEALHQRLLSSAPSTHARTLALSSVLPHAGDWLNGVPSAALGLLHDREFCSCLRYWLGVPLHSTSYFCPECHGTADPFGDY